MKIARNRRKDNLNELMVFLQNSKLEITSSNYMQIALWYNGYIVRKANTGKDKKSNTYQKRLKHSYQRSLRVVQLYCYINNIANNLGYVYIISNPAFPGWFKIGAAKDAETRLNTYQTYSPFRDYVLEYYTLVDKYELKEKEILSSFSHRNNEWVYAPIEEIIACVA
ncbi:MAG: GIY-YIG nuclease family protein [Negativicutes bacterium]|nr:GIY-YIG nuclease family protein [Negativicutes bacterium]